MPIRVLTPSGFATAVVKPGFSLSSKGQLAEGHSGVQVAPQPATYQDVGFSGGLQSTHERGGWTFRTQSNYLGASRRQDALRFGIRQDAAPKVDLADYLVQLQRGPATLSLGHVTEGANRHLINAFASRGVEMRVGGSAASVALAAMNGSSVLGWDNITGLDDGNLAWRRGRSTSSCVPRRPGALHIDATLLRGSLLPRRRWRRAPSWTPSGAPAPACSWPPPRRRSGCASLPASRAAASTTRRATRSCSATPTS